MMIRIIKIDPSLLLPYALAMQFRMTRFIGVRRNGAGRHSNSVLFANQICRPAPFQCVLASLVILNRQTKVE
jgi:hypothetical protein